MSKHLARDLENLQRQLLLMAGYVEEAIYKSIEALQHHDKSLAQELERRGYDWVLESRVA